MSDLRILIELQFMPPVEYLQLFDRAGEVILEAHEHYQKHSYRNRCHIMGANGIQRLSVPLVQGKNAGMPIRDVRIAYDTPWQRQHQQTIRSAYGRAPFYAHYIESFSPLFENKYTFLWDLNLDILQTLCRHLGSTAKITLSEDYHKTVADDILDMRNTIVPHPEYEPVITPEPYPQVFEERFGFTAGLSAFDYLCCHG